MGCAIPLAVLPPLRSSLFAMPVSGCCIQRRQSHSRIAVLVLNLSPYASELPLERLYDAAFSLAI
jgi:hypothetical protein